MSPEKKKPPTPNTRVRTLNRLFSEATMSEIDIGGVRKWGVMGVVIGPAPGSGWFSIKHDDGTKGNYAQDEFEVIT